MHSFRPIAYFGCTSTIPTTHAEILHVRVPQGKTYVGILAFRLHFNPWEVTAAATRINVPGLWAGGALPARQAENPVTQNIAIISMRSSTINRNYYLISIADVAELYGRILPYLSYVHNISRRINGKQRPSASNRRPPDITDY